MSSTPLSNENIILDTNVDVNSDQDKIIYSSLLKRLIAFFLDVFLGYLSLFIFLKVGLGIPLNVIIHPWGWGRLIIAYSFFTYFLSLLYFNKGQTYGCKLLKIKVIKMDGSNLTFLSAFFRSGIITLIACPLTLDRLSLLMAGTILAGSLFSLVSGDTKKKKQTVWDLSKHYVVDIKS